MDPTFELIVQNGDARGTLVVGSGQRMSYVGDTEKSPNEEMVLKKHVCEEVRVPMHINYSQLLQCNTPPQ